ncbi:CotH kinase family protein [Blautia sp.]
MKKYRKLAGILAGSMILSLFAGCIGAREKVQEEKNESTDTEEKGTSEESQNIKKADTQDIDQVHLRDKDSLYENDDDTSVVTMYLTVSKGNSSENTNHTWQEINSYSTYDYEEMGVERYQTAALLQVGDENGPVEGMVGYGESVPNATVQIRGQTSSRNAQKNYKIELKKNKGTWRGQRTINLNKHMTEGMRFRNKLAYDLLKGIPQLISLRTQFVHLYVKDTTDGSADSEFEDYGLYTQVEQFNKTGMKNHGLDSNGQLYKINYFEFYRNEDVIKLQSDPTYDSTAFEELLETKGNTDNSKLIQMLDAVNDYSIPIDTILEDYFDEENFTYWMGFQILMGNVDTQNRNMYLYSPLNSDTWYFIPWDNDGCLMRPEYDVTGFSDHKSWESGISNYWGNVLFQRCLKSDHFRQKLDEAILDLKEYLSKERLGTMIENYKTVVKSYLYKMPDAFYAPLTSEQYDELAAALPEEIEQNYQLYVESLSKPMPFYIGIPEADGEKMKITWEPSYSFDAENITYSVEVARDYLFQDVISSQEGLQIPETKVSLPEAGQYFIRVRAVNEEGNIQDAFDYYVTDEGKHYGMKCIYVTEDGQIEEDIYEE